MPIIIDGHNLIGQLATPSLRDVDDEEQLVRLLVSYQARTGKRITVVFDPGVSFSMAVARRYGRVEVVYAPFGGTADALISRRVAKSRNPGEWLVVTSDRKLTEAVTRFGARTMSADRFAVNLDPQADLLPGQKETPLTPQEVDDWLAIFEESDQSPA